MKDQKTRSFRDDFRNLTFVLWYKLTTKSILKSKNLAINSSQRNM
jgi:hypothetical protein